MYDAIVIGARCAGASTAMLLARQGHKVLLVDRSTIPSEIPHGHFIHRGGPLRLNKWGLLDKIVASGCPPVSEVKVNLGDFPLTGKDLNVDGVPLGLGPRRRVLDKILVDASVEAGAEVRERFVVEDFTTDGDRITGVKGRDTQANTRHTEQAQIVIGADGRNSRLARAAQAPEYEYVPSISCYYFSYWSGVPGAALELYVTEQQVIFAFPTNDNLFAVFIGWPIERFQQVRSDIEGNFMKGLEKAPDLARRVRAGRQEEPFYGTADLPNFFRKPYGPGWALVGDAGHHKDPFMALGVADAFRDADLLSAAVQASLSGARPLDEALADYERQRNKMSMAVYHENIARARFTPPPPEAFQLRAALRENQNQEDINRFTMASLGLIPREAFFNPENIGRIIQSAAMRIDVQ